MEIVYALGVAVILRLLYSLIKGLSAKRRQIQIVNPEQVEVDLNTITEKSENISTTEAAEADLKPEIEKTIEIGNNKWLYPTDGFGIMEGGVVDYEAERRKKKKIIFMD